VLFIYIPAVEIMHLLMRIRKFEPFARNGRIITFSLISLSIVSLANVWASAPDPNSPGCVLGKWGCYQGDPLSFLDLVARLGMSQRILLLPVIDMLAVLLVLFRARRTFLTLLLLSPVSLLVQFSSQPAPYVDYIAGCGYHLHMIAHTLVFFLAVPLALDEQLELHPDWDYKKYLPRYLTE
jgi:hypothetical protein